MKKLLISFVTLVSACSLHAQICQSPFFMQDNAYSYRWNSAVTDTVGFIGSVGMTSISRSNAGTGSFIYRDPAGDGLVYGLNSAISAETFLGNLKDETINYSILDVNLLAYGRAKGTSYHTFEVNLKGDYGFTVPKDIFEILKSGTTKGKYNLSGLSFRVNSYAEFAYGYSRRINSKLSLGMRAKLLVGFVGGIYNMDKMDLVLTGEKYSVSTDAHMYATSSMYNMAANDNGNLDISTIRPLHEMITPCGLGASFDFGVQYKPVRGLELTFAVNDLGGIAWRYNNVGLSSGTAEFDGFDSYNVLSGKSEELKETLKETLNDFLGTVKLAKGSSVTNFKFVPVSINAGVRYTMPFYDRLCVGVTGLYEKATYYSYYDVRAGAGIRPWRWLELSANAGKCTYNAVYGWSVAAHIQKFCLALVGEGPFSKNMPASATPIDPYETCLGFSVSYSL